MKINASIFRHHDGTLSLGLDMEDFCAEWFIHRNTYKGNQAKITIYNLTRGEIRQLGQDIADTVSSYSCEACGAIFKDMCICPSCGYDDVVPSDVPMEREDA